MKSRSRLRMATFRFCISRPYIRGCADGHRVARTFSRPSQGRHKGQSLNKPLPPSLVLRSNSVQVILLEIIMAFIELEGHLIQVYR